MQTHRAHDYPFLIRRWRALAARARLRVELLANARGAKHYFIRTPALTPHGGLYLSAGIHGDEPAATEALLVWAEQNAARLRDLPLLILPCLNPWGLVNNSRFDDRGIDLNRTFHLDTSPPVRAVKRLIATHCFDAAIMLHEDYDGQGLYLYELDSARPFWGEKLLDAARPIIPIEGRKKVDGYKAKGGIVRRRFNQKRFDAIGYPEAIWLHLHHAQRSITVETPSEFALTQRVQAHVAVLDAAAHLAGLGKR